MTKTGSGGIHWHLTAYTYQSRWSPATSSRGFHGGRLRRRNKCIADRASHSDNPPGNLHEYSPQRTSGVLPTRLYVATGGTSPYHWSIATGALPNGLGINAASGMIAGQPANAGTFGFTISVQDSSAKIASAKSKMSMQITAAPATKGHCKYPQVLFPTEKLATLMTAQWWLRVERRLISGPSPVGLYQMAWVSIPSLA